MPLYLRAININRWLKLNMGEWVGKQDIPADNLKDFRTDENELSLWLILEDRSNLNEVISALAARRRKIEPLDYILFNSEILNDQGIATDKTNGDSANEYANNNWHFDGLDFSGRNLVGLIHAIISSNYEYKRYQAKDVKTLVKNEIKQGNIQYGRIHTNLKEKIPNPLAD